MARDTDKTRVNKVFRVAREGKPGEGPAEGAELLPKRWYCAAVSSSGELVKSEAESAARVRDILEGSELAWVDFWADDFEKDAPRAATQLGFSDLLVSYLVGEYASNYQDFNTEMGMRFPAIHVVQFEVEAQPLVMLLKRNLVFTVHPLTADRRFARLRRYSDSVLRKIPRDAPAEDRLTMLVTRIIDENNDRNFEDLRKIEERGDALSESLMDPKTPREKIGPEIHHMKHALITYLNALWETVDVLNALRFGDAELITENAALLNRITIMADDVNRQIGLGEHMSEVLASGLEVLQSIYNNQLQMLSNRLTLVMTYLTILGTAVLVPNTLATVFSSSAFNLGPEDIGWYVAMLIGSTIAATGAAWWWVRKGWLPKKMD